MMMGRGSGCESSKELTTLPASMPIPTPDVQGLKEAASASAPASNFSTELESPRQRFFVELKQGETTIVSLKELLPVATRDNMDGTPVDSNLAPDEDGTDEEQNPPGSGPHRFTLLIGRIERLYKGAASDEEGSKDDEKYDTLDSWIDDKALDDYLTADKSSKTKHSGFYIHRGQLEPATSPGSPVAKKRKRSCVSQPSEAAKTGRTTKKQKPKDTPPGCVADPQKGKPKPRNVKQQSRDQALAAPTKAKTRNLKSGTAAPSTKRRATEVKEPSKAKAAPRNRSTKNTSRQRDTVVSSPGKGKTKVVRGASKNAVAPKRDSQGVVKKAVDEVPASNC